jgi:hypothetical protein
MTASFHTNNVAWPLPRSSSLKSFSRTRPRPPPPSSPDVLAAAKSPRQSQRGSNWKQPHPSTGLRLVDYRWATRGGFYNPATREWKGGEEGLMAFLKSRAERQSRGGGGGREGGTVSAETARAKKQRRGDFELVAGVPSLPFVPSPNENLGGGGQFRPTPPIPPLLPASLRFSPPHPPGAQGGHPPLALLPDPAVIHAPPLCLFPHMGEVSSPLGRGVDDTLATAFASWGAILPNRGGGGKRA